MGSQRLVAIAAVALIVAAMAVAGATAEQAGQVVDVPSSTIVAPFGSITFSQGPPAGTDGPTFVLDVVSRSPEPLMAEYQPQERYDSGAQSSPGVLTLTAPSGAVVEVQSGCQPSQNYLRSVSCDMPLAIPESLGPFTLPRHPTVIASTRAAGYAPPPGSCPLPIPPYSAPATPPPPPGPGSPVCDARGLGVAGFGCRPPPPAFSLSPLGQPVRYPPSPTQRTIPIPGSVSFAPGDSVTFYDPQTESPRAVVSFEGGGGCPTASYDDAGLTIQGGSGAVVVTTTPDPCEPAGEGFPIVVCPDVNVDPSAVISFQIADNGYPTQNSFTAALGWNLIGVPSGTILPGRSPIYALGDPAAGASYHALPPHAILQGGKGYWLYIPPDLNISPRELVAAGPATAQTVSLPSDEWVMAGNPFSMRANVSGADTLLIYDQVTNDYRDATTLYPGQGAWAYSGAGGSLTFTPAAGDGR